MNLIIYPLSYRGYEIFSSLAKLFEEGISLLLQVPIAEAMDACQHQIPDET